MGRGSRRASASQASLRFRAPGVPLALGALIERALPEPGAAAAAIARGAVRVDGRARRDARGEVAPGSSVEILVDAPNETAAAPASPAWRVLVPAPPWPAGCIGAPGGALCFEVEQVRGAVAELRVDRRPEADGADRGAVSAKAVLDALAALGHPAIGDVRRGGVLAAGGLRLRAEPGPQACGDPSGPPHSGEGPGAAACAAPATGEAPAWWPAEPLWLGRSPRAGGSPPALAISTASARILARGHPWVLCDADSGDPARFRPGALVRLVATDGRDAGLALVDGEGDRVARRWSGPGERATGIEARVAAAFERRARLLARDDTDALRLVHGEADGLPGLAIDRLGAVLRVLVHGRTALALREPARAAALRELAERVGVEAAVVEVVHLRGPSGPLARRAQLVAVRHECGALPELDDRGRLRVRERGLRFAVDLGLAEPTRSAPGVGLFLDQRDNRERLAGCVRRGARGHWLNLFAHTGAFSVALLAAGAREVTSVDLSARYLRWLDDHLELNRDLGVDPGHHTGVRRDGRRFLEALGARDRFDGIVLDPPTAAAAGRRYWSVRKDLQPLIEASLGHLAPGGWLLVARNDRGRRGPTLRDAVVAAAERTGVRLRQLEPARPGSDFPSLPGFPEGDPFRAVLVQREGGA